MTAVAAEGYSRFFAAGVGRHRGLHFPLGTSFSYVGFLKRVGRFREGRQCVAGCGGAWLGVLGSGSSEIGLARAAKIEQGRSYGEHE